MQAGGYVQEKEVVSTFRDHLSRAKCGNLGREPMTGCEDQFVIAALVLAPELQLFVRSF